MNKEDKLTLEYLKRILHYNPDTGIWTWLINIKPRKISIGDQAGSISHGYVDIKIKGISYKAHRLSWFYMTGIWPKNYIDHKDLNKSNNKWSNLREATKSDNKKNILKRKDNKSGFKGVGYHKEMKKYRARIHINGKEKVLGFRNTPEEAHELYKKAALEYFGEFSRF